MNVKDLTPAQIEAIRQQFITNGKPAKIGEPFGLSGKQVSDYACKHDWKKQKAEFGEVLAEKSSEVIASRLVATAADYVTQHTGAYQALYAVMLAPFEIERPQPPKLTGDTNADTLAIAGYKVAVELHQLELKSALSIALAASEIAKGGIKAVQLGQRLSLGLDKPTLPPPPTPAGADSYDPADLDDDELQRRIEAKIRPAGPG